jgi:hypothetical protein
LLADQISGPIRSAIFSPRFSNWNAADVDEAAPAPHDPRRRVIEHYVTPLMVLHRAAVP